MGVENIYEFLKRNGGNFFSTKEIAKELGLTENSVSNSLKVLRKRKEVVSKTLHDKLGQAVPRYALRTTELYV